jgi:glycerophosphoryl diester phosphodiesterase
VSAFDAGSLRRFAELEPALPRSYTLPRDRFGISKRGPLAPALRGDLPRRLPSLLKRARADAATLHYSVASTAAIARAHDLGAAVYVWTVDDPVVARRLVAAEADGIITNDPRIFANVTA